MLAKYYPDADMDSLLLTNKNETLLHLACKGTVTRVLDNKDELTEKIECTYDEEDYQELIKQNKENEQKILMKAYPCLDFILEHFKKNPDFMSIGKHSALIIF